MTLSQRIAWTWTVGLTPTGDDMLAWMAEAAKMEVERARLRRFADEVVDNAREEERIADRERRCARFVAAVLGQ